MTYPHIENSPCALWMILLSHRLLVFKTEFSCAIKSFGEVQPARCFGPQLVVERGRENLHLEWYFPFSRLLLYRAVMDAYAHNGVAEIS